MRAGGPVLTDGTRVHAITNASNNSADDHLRNAVCRRLQHGSDGQDETTQPDAVLATKLFTSEQAEKRSSETSDLVDGDNKSLERVAAIACRGVDLRELVGKSRASEKTAHHTLVLEQKVSLRIVCEVFEDVPYPINKKPEPAVAVMAQSSVRPVRNPIIRDDVGVQKSSQVTQDSPK